MLAEAKRRREEDAKNLFLSFEAIETAFEAFKSPEKPLKVFEHHSKIIINSPFLRPFKGKDVEAREARRGGPSRPALPADPDHRPGHGYGVGSCIH